MELAQAWPNDPRVYRELGILYLQGYGDSVQGRQFLMRSYELDPSQDDVAEMLSDPRSAMPSVPGLPELPGMSGLPGLPGTAGSSRVPQIPGAALPGLP